MKSDYIKRNRLKCRILRKTQFNCVYFYLDGAELPGRFKFIVHMQPPIEVEKVDLEIRVRHAKIAVNLVQRAQSPSARRSVENLSLALQDTQQ